MTHSGGRNNVKQLCAVVDLDILLPAETDVDEGHGHDWDIFDINKGI